ncbi:d64a0d03-433d-47bd-872e-8aec2a73f6e8 [Sclerotinia trifoliorum]|uniref:D64a0d03-433d-47bd-872e-8aec2a73f6e8 n=1 Tax=Sclerotinia trifoliorum TaxID=28548 RepID=A0A8H2ZPZ9_9HELO|nr:d64a0d03-433d-47bd-872e-8aec2a73f6e8 [Sclerotinia trifoliorum]
MPTPAYFSKCPPFPSNIPVANVPAFSFAKLAANDQYESHALFEASRRIGFFYLDFTECLFGDEFLKGTKEMLDLNAELHALPKEKLTKYAYNPPISLFHYKPLGYHKIGKTGDRVELYGISRDDITGVSEPLLNPFCIERSRPQLRNYIKQANAVVCVILGHLEKHLKLPLGTFSKLQPMTKPSGSVLRMLKYEPQPPDDRRTAMMGHTDITALTLLFSTTGGLQILNDDADPHLESSWTHIKPRPSACIVNLGDAMVEWTGGILRSAMHRVISAPGDQAITTRYVVGYFARPAGDSLMKRLAPPEYPSSLIPPVEDEEDSGNDMNARDWEWHKLSSVKAGNLGGSLGGKPFEPERDLKELFPVSIDAA